MNLTRRQRDLEARRDAPTADLMRSALRRGRSISKAAADLGISRPTFRSWAAKHCIDAQAEIARAILGEVA